MFADVQVRQLQKTGEELCGDAVAWHRGDGELAVVLADGLGSGVKANILSTMTGKIALTLFRERMPLDDVVQTLAATLPTCQVRNLAYSTFSLVRVTDAGALDIVEFDNPPTFVFRGGWRETLEYEERQIGPYRLRQAHGQLAEGDCLVIASDGLTHAGLGGREPLGWRWEAIAEHLEAFLSQGPEAEEIADNLIDSARSLYRERIGDDTSLAVVACRPFRQLTLAVGPPADRRDDARMAELLANADGVKAICGGTTSKLIARCLGRPLEVDLAAAASRDVPPPGRIAGIDLVTEGVITLMHAINTLDSIPLHSRPRVPVHDVGFLYGQRKSGPAYTAPIHRAPAPEEEGPAHRLARALRLADKVTILLGTALNPAHQSADLPVQLGLKFHLIEHLAEKLRARGKAVELVKF
jgi:hypothetical protein